MISFHLRLKHIFQEDILGRRPSHATFSPDGRRVIYVWSKEGPSQLWLVSTEDRKPKQLTKFEEGISDYAEKSL